MGSLVLAQPMVNALRRQHPQATLYPLVFAQNREVAELLDGIDPANILTIRNDSLTHFLSDSLRVTRTLKRIPIDTVIDCELFSRASAILSFLSGARVRVGFERQTLEGLYRGRFINRAVPYNPYQHISQQFLTLAASISASGRPVPKRALDPRPVLEPKQLDTAELEAMRVRLDESFPATGRKRLVLVYPGGGLLPIRAWPLESFKELTRRLTGAGHAVGVVGLASDGPLACALQEAGGQDEVLDLTGFTRTVRELLALFHHARLLVTNDGGPGHFASLTPLRTLMLFGPETPALYGSLAPDAIHFFRGLSCSPCLSAYNHRRSPCDGDNQCLKTIPVDEVFETVQAILSEG